MGMTGLATSLNSNGYTNTNWTLIINSTVIWRHKPPYKNHKDWWPH